MTKGGCAAGRQKRHVYWLAEQWKRSVLYPKFRQIRLEKRGGQHFDVQ
jgi:hypothetical protein